MIKVYNRSRYHFSYICSGKQLTKVTDVMCNVWTYGYDKNGQFNSKTDHDGIVIKIDYVLSVSIRITAMRSG